MMARKFDIPEFYRSPIASTIKEERSRRDPGKKDLSPAVIDAGPVRFKISRHFGFCFGVQNAIETAFRAIRENPERRIFLLSEMIHNPAVNADLETRGVRFIFDPGGTQIVSFDELSPEDIVIVPAFGTTTSLMKELEKRGIDPLSYNATCPFVEKVWKRAGELAAGGFTTVIHGKHLHEETKATFSHACCFGPGVIIRDLEEAEIVAARMRGSVSEQEFEQHFKGRCSEGFDSSRDLERLGIVNQTTMPAGETQAISAFLRGVMRELYGEEDLAAHFADTRETLCYATTENQRAVNALVASGGMLALVIGGYNSSNTSHLAGLCREHLPTYHIKDAAEIISPFLIRHRDTESGEIIETRKWLPDGEDPVEILVTAGASSPDSLVDACLLRIAGLLGVEGRLLSRGGT